LKVRVLFRFIHIKRIPLWPKTRYHILPGASVAPAAKFARATSSWDSQFEV